jgi:hypothetical protein
MLVSQAVARRRSRASAGRPASTSILAWSICSCAASCPAPCEFSTRDSQSSRCIARSTSPIFTQPRISAWTRRSRTGAEPPTMDVATIGAEGSFASASCSACSARSQSSTSVSWGAAAAKAAAAAAGSPLARSTFARRACASPRERPLGSAA